MLNAYSNTVDAIKLHVEENKAVFDAHQKLVMRQIDADAVLRDAAVVTGSLSNGRHDVTVTPQTMTYGDVEAIDDLIAHGLISPGLRDRIVKTIERPAHVRIGESKEA